MPPRRLCSRTVLILSRGNGRRRRESFESVLNPPFKFSCINVIFGSTKLFLASGPKFCFAKRSVVGVDPQVGFCDLHGRHPLITVHLLVNGTLCFSIKAGPR